MVRQPRFPINERGGARFDPCADLQADISALIDSELDSERAGRVLVHIEMCPKCRRFMRSLRTQIDLHRELWQRAASEPEPVLDEDPWAGDLFADADVWETDVEASAGEGSFVDHLVAGGAERLADIFYQLGRAYILLTTSRDFVRVVCRGGVPIPEYRLRGRALLDGVTGGRSPSLEAGDREEALAAARKVLEERIDSVASNLEKARHLLLEALQLRPEYVAAQIWLSQCHMHGNELEKARRLLERVVGETDTDSGPKDPITRVPLRVYALEALGNVCLQEGNPGPAMRYFQQVIDSGAPCVHSNFWTAYLNYGYAALRNSRPDRAAEAFEHAYERHPDRREDTARIFALRPDLARMVEEHAQTHARLSVSCPQWFGPGVHLEPGPTVSFQIISDANPNAGRTAPLDPVAGGGA